MQKTKFLSTLVARRNSWRSLEGFLPELEALGTRHRRYGARPAHYPVIGDALLGATIETAGRHWKPE